MVKKGIFDSDDKVELLDGLLVVKEPQSSLHSSALLAAHAVLVRAFGRGYTVRPGLPVALDDYSEPDRAGITDYWVVNLMDEVLEVYRLPSKAPSRRFGWKYGSVKLLKRGATVTPLAAPRAKIRVADLLP